MINNIFLRFAVCFRKNIYTISISILFLFAFEKHAYSADMPINEQQAAVEKLYSYLTKPIPNLRIAATIETHSPAVSEKQILEEAQNNAQAVYAEHDSLNEKDKKEIFDINLTQARKRHAPIQKISFREWIGPKLYRQDLLESSVQGPTTNVFKGGSNILYTLTTIYDRKFSKVTTWRANPVGKTAVVTEQKSQYKTADLWILTVCEPELAFPFLTQTAGKTTIPLKYADSWPNGSCSAFGSMFSQTRVLELLTGKNSEYTLQVQKDQLGGNDCVVMTLSAKNADKTMIAYYMDYPKQERLLKVASKYKESSWMTSTRNLFDTNGVPHEWICEGNKKADESYKKVTVLEAEVNPKWDVNEIFAPAFPTNFNVEDVTSGVGKRIH